MAPISSSRSKGAPVAASAHSRSAGMPFGRAVSPSPVQKLLGMPSTEHRVTGASTGTEPVCAGAPCVGSHRLPADASTATTMLQALTGSTPSIWALGVMALVGRSFTSGKPGIGMPDCVAVPAGWQSLPVLPVSPTLMEQMLMGAQRLTAPFCVVWAEGWPVVSPSAEAAWPSRPIALPSTEIGTLIAASTWARGDDWAVVLEPVVESCPGRRLPPISLPDAVVGKNRGVGSWVTGASALAAGATAGVA